MMVLQGQVTIMNTKAYEAGIKEFMARLVMAIAEKDNTVHVTTEAVGQSEIMQFGKSVIKIVIHTESSGRDEYLVWINGEHNAQFIRNIT